ncbi:MAG: hypothetical protein QNJ45_21315 [Ardenticatenaceae bacterium]|nr:hypothetical protein [Ardenticatenaceae bacterium]
MNIFSRFLAQWSDDQQLHQFIAHWDVVEALAIQTYRQKKVDQADAARYRQSRAWLLEAYDGFVDQLRPLWQESLVAGTADHEDPFSFVLAATDLEEFLDNWAALQHLPAAREAINKLSMINGQ